MNAMFKTLEAFYDGNPERRYSGEAGYGVHWKLAPWPHSWRVAYVRNTGEIYAVHLDGAGSPVFILGTVPPDPETSFRETYYRTLDRILEGWPEHCGQPAGLAWVKERLTAWTKGEGQPHQGS